MPCKTPFEGDLAERAYQEGLITDDDWFGREDLLRKASEQGTPIGLVIDLVNTEKYYKGFVDGFGGVQYRKLRIKGKMLPDWSLMEQAFTIIDNFAKRRPNQYVAVHCTLGDNRTGYLVAAYLMWRGHYTTARKAVTTFEKARGHKLTRKQLLYSLVHLESEPLEQQLQLQKQLQRQQ